MKSHIINGHYMFGNTFIQPEMPMYERIYHHNMAPVGRPMPPYPDIVNRPNCHNGKHCCYLGYESESNKVDAPYDDSIYNEINCECKDCPFAPDSVIRDPLMFNVVDIQTSIIKTLKVTIYGVSPDQDKTVEMKIGNRYAITYITEHGLITSIGRLELISESVPDDCTRYINTNNMAAASTAYIGMDCSSEGNSDKRKIYIGTIRYIQLIEDGKEEEVVITTKPIRERLEELLESFEKGELGCDCGENEESIALKERVNALLDYIDGSAVVSDTLGITVLEEGSN